MRIQPSLQRSLLALLLALGLASTAAAAARRIFVTSVSGPGRLGDWPDAGAAIGLAAGDAICRARAAAAGLPNAATYRAWLSTSATDAYCHVHGLNAEEKFDDCGGVLLSTYGPWYQVNGTVPVTPRLSLLTASSGRITYSPIAYDEFGSAIPYDTHFAWTGTDATGVADADTCNGWISDTSLYQGRFGGALATGDMWTDMNTRGCDEIRRLICVEPGASDAFEPGWSEGRLVFVTSVGGSGVFGSWPDAGGAESVEAADAICRARAAAGHLPDPTSFFAWVSADWLDAGSRVSSSGAIRRLDGFMVAASKADLVDGATLNSIHVDEFGTYGTFTTSVRTGTTGAGTKSSLNCVNWTSTMAENAIVGNAMISRDDGWTSLIQSGCAGSARIYCFSNTRILFWDGFDYGGGASRWSATVD